MLLLTGRVLLVLGLGTLGLAQNGPVSTPSDADQYCGTKPNSFQAGAYYCESEDMYICWPLGIGGGPGQRVFNSDDAEDILALSNAMIQSNACCADCASTGLCTGNSDVSKVTGCSIASGGTPNPFTNGGEQALNRCLLDLASTPEASTWMDEQGDGHLYSINANDFGGASGNTIAIYYDGQTC